MIVKIGIENEELHNQGQNLTIRGRRFYILRSQFFFYINFILFVTLIIFLIILSIRYFFYY